MVDRVEESIFAQNITLADAQEAVAGLKEFYEKKFEEEGHQMTIFNYRFCSPGTFPDPEDFPVGSRERYLMKVRRECRGLVFDGDVVVARRLHKFFNVGERPRTQPEAIDMTRPHIMLTKMDGSLVSAIPAGNAAKWATKSGFTEMAAQIAPRLGEVSDRYLAWSKSWLDQGYTPLFEWCDARSPINIKYSSDRLVLLCVRHNPSGHYMPHDRVRESAAEHGIEIAPVFEGDFSGAQGLLDSIGPREGIEGCVIRFHDDGAMYKVKTQWYFSLSHSKIKGESLLTNERYLWKMILDGSHDDLTAATQDAEFIEAVARFSDVLLGNLSDLEAEVRDFCVGHRDTSRGDFSGVVRTSYPKLHHGLYYAVYDAIVVNNSDNAMPACMMYVAKYLNSEKRLDEVRPLLKGIKFEGKDK